ncbi:IS701 family transposase [Saccharothrix isguenensis]
MSTIAKNQYEQWLKVVYDRIAVNFSRAEPRRRAWTYLADLPRAHASGLRNRDGLGNYSGEQRADGVQRLLTSAQWSETQVRDELRAIAVHYGGSTGGILYLAEVAFPKKGRNAVAVERQYNPETMRAEKCQIGLLLFHVTAQGRAFLVDRELYVPKSWADDAQRCARAGIPDDYRYRTKSAIGGIMVRRAFEAGIQPDFVISSVFCNDKLKLQKWLRHKQVPHIISITAGEVGQARHFADDIALRPADVQRAADHHRLGDFDRRHQASHHDQETCAYKRGILHKVKLDGDAPAGFESSYLIASPSTQNAGPRSYFACYLRQRTPLPEITPIVSLMQSTGAYCKRAKEEIGLGHYEVRSWRGWYRHITLAMAAHTALELAREPSSALRIA